MSLQTDETKLMMFVSYRLVDLAVNLLVDVPSFEEKGLGLGEFISSLTGSRGLAPRL